MEQPGPTRGCGRLPDPPRDVRVTIIRGPQPRAPRAVPIRAVVTVVLIAAAVVAVIGTTGRRQVDSPRAAPLAAAGAARLPAVAAVYRFPLGCLGASLAAGATRPGVADHAGPCWRYGVFLTAILRRIHGVWRLGLEAVSRRCPSVSLPASVQMQLVTCRR